MQNYEGMASQVVEGRTSRAPSSIIIVMGGMAVNEGASSV